MFRSLSISHVEFDFQARETRPEQGWSNGTEFFGYFDFPE